VRPWMNDGWCSLNTTMERWGASPQPPLPLRVAQLVVQQIHRISTRPRQFMQQIRNKLVDSSSRNPLQVYKKLYDKSTTKRTLSTSAQTPLPPFVVDSLYNVPTLQQWLSTR